MSENAAPAATEITTEDLGEIIRIVDPELDVQAILEEIRANLATRPKLDPDPSTLAYRRGDGSAASSQIELGWQIDQAADMARFLDVGDQLRPGTGTVGRIATRLKRPLHQLVRFYVELLGQRQAALEGHVVGALRALATRTARSDDEIAALRQEVAALRQELAALRSTPPAG